MTRPQFLAISSPRLASASGSRKLGLTEPSSPKNGIGSSRRAQRSKKRLSASERTGKAHRLDQGMGDEHAACLMRGTLQQGKHAGMYAAFLRRRRNRFTHDLAGAGMGRMALDHHRTTGGKSGRGVPARCRKGQRKIGSAEKRPPGRSGAGSFSGQAKAGLRRAWLHRDGGRGSRLPVCAAQKGGVGRRSVRARLQGALPAGRFRQKPIAVMSAPRFSISSAILFKKSRAGLAAGIAIIPECGLGGLDRLVDVFLVGLRRIPAGFRLRAKS